MSDVSVDPATPTDSGQLSEALCTVIRVLMVKVGGTYKGI